MGACAALRRRYSANAVESLPPAAASLGPLALVGRAAELAALRSLHEAGARLVTLVGAPGAGKTHLARHFAESLRAVACDLADARECEEAYEAMARALRVELAPGESPRESAERVGRALAARETCVVVLDNFEPSSATLKALSEWRALAPGARFLVTSRERLRLPDEHLVTVAPLTVPPAEVDDPARAATFDSVALFLTHARAARGDFTLDASNTSAVVSIVRRAEGLPLAIALCAARVGVLAPSQILAAFERCLATPVPDHRGARLTSVRDALDRSWRTLTAHDREALARCAVFEDGWSLDAAEAVLCGYADPLVAMQRLHERSLVEVEEPLAGQRRYRLLRVVRAYAAEKLDAEGTRDVIEARHAAHYLAQCETLATREPRDGAARQRLALDAENLHAACARALTRAPVSATAARDALRGLVALGATLAPNDAMDDYASLLAEGLAAVSQKGDPAREDSSLRARAWLAQGMAAVVRGRLDEAATAYTEALTWSAEDKATRGRALVKLGALAALRGDHREASERFDAARDAVSGDPLAEGIFFADLGFVRLREGRVDDAADLQERAVERFRVAGDGQREGHALASRAEALLHLGRLAGAERCCREALDLLVSAGSVRTASRALACLARVQQERGDRAAARSTVEAALATLQSASNPWFEGMHHALLGSLALEEGDARAAYDHHLRAMALLPGPRDRVATALNLAGLGAAAASRGLVTTAAEHFEAAERMVVSGAPAAIVTVTVHRAHLDLARAQIAADEGDATRAQEFRAAALATLARAEETGAGGGPPIMRCSADVRLAVRALRSALARTALGGDPASANVDLVVGPEARWFVRAGGERVDLLRQRAMRLILDRLTEERLNTPGRALPLGELFAAGWPGERVRAESALNRVHVTLSKLRGLGLRGVLQSRDDGLLLDAAATVRRSTEP